MAEITSDVYDICHPTPKSLKELSAIFISLQVWRYQVNQLRNSGDILRGFRPSRVRMSSKNMLADLPTVSYPVIDKYIRRFGQSLECWLEDHHVKIFFFYLDDQNFILEYFDDFVCEYSGAIDYTRTAERMMNCDQFDDNVKFMVACMYFFEHDIRRIWPFVEGNMRSMCNENDFFISPQLYYWILRLQNELYRVPVPAIEMNDSVEEVMFNAFMSRNRPSVEYFWNHIPTENRMQKAVHIFARDVISFVRFILPKLNDQQLDEFVNERSYELIRALVGNAWQDKELILSTWTYIKGTMNANAFTNLVFKMLRSEIADEFSFNMSIDPEGRGRNPLNWLFFCCEIWNSAPEALKRSAIVNIISDMKLFDEDFGAKILFIMPPIRKHFQLLPDFLSHATCEQRRKFWLDCWGNLIRNVHWKDLSKIMKACFESDAEMALFKENVIAKNDYVSFTCITSLKCFDFHYLNDCVNFLFSDVQAARNFKQQLLQSVFLDGNGDLDDRIIRKRKEFREFVQDAYANVDLCRDFGNKFMSSPLIQEELSRISLLVPFEELVEFIDSFVPTEETRRQIKTCLIDFWKEQVSDCNFSPSEFHLTSILSWCLGSYEKAVQFKVNYLL